MEKSKISKAFKLIENNAVLIIILLLSLIPVTESILRIFKLSIEGAERYISHLVLLLTFVGGMLTTREKQHLSIAAFLHMTKGTLNRGIKLGNAVLASVICTALGWASLLFTTGAFIPDDPGSIIGFIPVQFFTIFLPIGFFVMAVRFLICSDFKHKGLFLGLGLFIGTLISIPTLIELIYGREAIFAGELPAFATQLHSIWYSVINTITIPCIILLIAAALFGAPLFAVLGAITYLLFSGGLEFLDFGAALSSISNRIYDLFDQQPNLPAIPLFTFVGFILAESQSGKRLIRLFRAWFGWIPGGVVIVAVLVSAFFTTFTGASGITILALGAILFTALSKEGRYSEDYSVGLLTASGSIGLLFPPSLPIILYGSIALVNIAHIFLGGILPGILMVIAMSITGVVISIRKKIPVIPFKLKEAISSLKDAVFEILLPFIIIIPLFLGLGTLVEISAFTVFYVLVITLFVRKEKKIRDLNKIALKGAVIIGGVLIILGVASAFSEYLVVEKDITALLKDFLNTHVQSPILFLLIVNVVLLLTGCIMDIYSALIVVAPIIATLGAQYGINPVHLGIIFIVNLEIGFLTPPIGLNLFLASYCFDKPIGKIYRNVLPFFCIQIIILLLVTYVPQLSTMLVDLFGPLIGGG
ncbi:MAG: TRAP transporter large permease subunit [Spirochaetales bacterium]|nr:TRAP transporter large permease subunit [Spirochaetales bacterium]